METVKLLIFTLVGSVGIAAIAGVLIGKHLLKKARGKRSLLSRKEQIIYAASVLCGIGLIAGGLFYKAPVPESIMENPGVVENPGGMNPTFDENIARFDENADAQDEMAEGDSGETNTAGEDAAEDENATEENPQNIVTPPKSSGNDGAVIGTADRAVPVG